MKRGERGSAMIEAALTFSMLIAMVLGLIHTGFKMMEYHFAAYASREATRYASVHSGQSAHPATAESVEHYVKQLAMGVDASAIRVTTQWTPDNSPGSTVRVDVQAGDSEAASQVVVLH